MPNERKDLTTAITDAIDAYNAKHPETRTSEVIISFVVIWRHFWRVSPKPGRARDAFRKRTGDKTPGFILEPPKLRDVWVRT